MLAYLRQLPGVAGARRLFPLVALFLGSYLALAAGPNSQTIPVTVILLVPSDGERYVTAAQAQAVLNTWVEAERSWLQAQTGQTYGVRFLTLRSEKTVSQLSAGTVDPCGEGANWGFAFNEAFSLAGIKDTSQGRYWLSMLGAGGWAGSNFYNGKYDVGQALMGDWGIARTLGRPIPCDPRWYSPTTGFMVETLHAMAVDSENPCLLDLAPPCNQMTASQVRDFRNKNRAFLR
jgi:hypothetical protein